MSRSSRIISRMFGLVLTVLLVGLLASAVMATDSEAFTTRSTDVDAAVIEGSPAKLLITEVCTMPSAQEFVEICNPTDVAVDMSDFYLCDSVYYDQGYWRLGQGNPSSETVGGGVYYDFNARFPDGFIIGAGDTITVSIAGSGAFYTGYEKLPVLELFEDDVSDDQVPNMRPVFESSIIGDTTPSLTNGGEIVVLYHWTEGDDLTTDIDIFMWGNGGSYQVTERNELTIGSSTYAPDSASQDVFTELPAIGSTYTRTDSSEGTQVMTGGNGVDGRDETSENLSTTFELLEASPCDISPVPTEESTLGGVRALYR